MIKNLYSISGLLPAQYRDDPSSNGIGWTTINVKQSDGGDGDILKKIVEGASAETLETIMEGIEKTGTRSKSLAVLSNDPKEPNEVSGDDYASARTEIKVGDFVQVLDDYDNSCGDDLVPGCVYHVKDITHGIIQVDANCDHPFICSRFVKKIDLAESIKVKRDKIEVGDFVQVDSDYDNQCGDKLVPGGIYLVRETDDTYSESLRATISRLSDSEMKWWIRSDYIKKIDLKIGTRVRVLYNKQNSGIYFAGRSGEIVRFNWNTGQNNRDFFMVCVAGSQFLAEEGQITLDE